MFFEKAGPVWDTLRALQERLSAAGIGYVVIGGLALNAYDYARQTVDVDVVLAASDYARFREQLGHSVYQKVEGAARRFLDPESGVTVDILIAGELAGRTTKNRTVRFPDPCEAEVHNDLRTVSLARLIELKLVTWRYKDWGDVVELIRAHHLPESFTDQLDATVQTAFKECFDQANDPAYDSP